MLFKFCFFSSASASCFPWYFFYPILVFSPPPAFLGSSAFRFFCGVAFACCSGCGYTFSFPFYLRFSTCCGSSCSLRPSSAFFHMLRLRLLVSVLPLRFSAYCSFGCPFLFLSPFSVCCDSSCSFWSSSRFFRILRLRLLFDFGPPPVVFRAVGSPWQSLGCPGAAFPAFLLVFFRKVFTACFVFLPCPSGCVFSLGVCSSLCLWWCSSLRLQFFLRWFCFALLVWLYGYSPASV